jgi:simple sugar transport system ATP-binding protein
MSQSPASEARGASPADVPAEPVVGLDRVTKRFPGVVAVDDVSFAVHAGEVHVLLGENGAGKSTIVGMLAGLQQPDEGTLTLGGTPATFASPADSLGAGISTVFQHVMLVPTLSVFENLVLGEPWWRRPPRARIADRMDEVSREFSLRLDLDAITGDLSLGEQQQIEIARALLRDSRVLILDEATSMLTPAGAEDLGRRMRLLASHGIAVVFITHKLGEAYSFGDRITVLRHGRLAGDITPEHLLAMSQADAVEEMVGLMFGTAATGAPAAPRAARAAGEVRLAVAGLSTAGTEGVRRVEDVSLTVRSGEVVGVTGIDGNGQKELAEALAGQRPVTAGRVELDGADITCASVGRRRGLGLRYLTDDRLAEGSVGAFPVAENLVLKEIGAPPFWTGGVERPARIAEHARGMIGRFSVRTPSEATPIARLSGGNIQKLLLGRELSGEARVVVFNKPTYGLDMQNIAASRDRIRELADAGLGVLLISTDLDELIELCDRIAVMADGRITGEVDAAADDTGALRLALGRLMVAGAAPETETVA